MPIVRRASYGDTYEFAERLSQRLEAEQGLTWDVTSSEDGDRWACRLENYLTDPGQEPDMSKWVTQLAFKLAD